MPRYKSVSDYSQKYHSTEWIDDTLINDLYSWKDHIYNKCGVALDVPISILHDFESRTNNLVVQEDTYRIFSEEEWLKELDKLAKNDVEITSEVQQIKEILKNPCVELQGLLLIAKETADIFMMFEGGVYMIRYQGIRLAFVK